MIMQETQAIRKSIQRPQIISDIVEISEITKILESRKLQNF